MQYTNYRWESVNARKGDRFHYKRDVVWPDMPWRTVESQAVATVTYDGNSKSPHWGKWHVNFGAQSPGLHRLRLQEIPVFSTKQDAINWATAMVTLEGLT
jgi:hypothetical protein